MPPAWNYQLRITLPPGTPTPPPELTPILAAHNATPVSQLAAFEAYLAEAAPDDPLARWTRATLEDPAKRAKHAAVLALRIGGAEVYPKPAADALEAALRPLLAAGLIAGLTRHDTNPETNMPIPAAYRA